MYEIRVNQTKKLKSFVNNGPTVNTAVIHNVNNKCGANGNCRPGNCQLKKSIPIRQTTRGVDQIKSPSSTAPAFVRVLQWTMGIAVFKYASVVYLCLTMAN